MAEDFKETRLQRWSRLKQEEQGAKSVIANPEGASEEAEDQPPEIRAEDLPDIDSLDENSDYTPFMQAGVPEELSRLALRKLWQSNPMFSIRDGLNEYDDDYSIIETIKAATDTAYKVGRGFIEDEPDTPDDDDGDKTDEDVGVSQDELPQELEKAPENSETASLSTAKEDAPEGASLAPRTNADG